MNRARGLGGGGGENTPDVILRTASATEGEKKIFSRQRGTPIRGTTWGKITHHVVWDMARLRVSLQGLVLAVAKIHTP